MTKAELIEELVSRHPALNKKQGGEILDSVFKVLAQSIRSSEKFTYPGFGTFKVTQRAARMGTNPRTKEPMPIPASKSVNFKPAKAFKEQL